MSTVPRNLALAVAAIATLIVSACGGSQPSQTDKKEGAKALPSPTPVSPQRTEKPAPDVASAKVPDRPAAAVPAPVPPSPKEKVFLTHPDGLPCAEGNLISNGCFAEWFVNERVPTGWSHGRPGIPEAEAASTIKRFVGDSFRGGVAIEQTWRTSDAAQAVTDHFGVTVKDLKPKTKYRLTVNARNESSATVTISPYAEMPPSGAEKETKYENLALAFVKLTAGGGMKEYSGEFTTGEQSTVRFTASCGAEDAGAYPVKVLWDEWALKEVE